MALFWNSSCNDLEITVTVRNCQFVTRDHKLFNHHSKCIIKSKVFLSERAINVWDSFPTTTI